MKAAALDTSVIVAALLAWHEAHARCRDFVRSLLQKKEPLLIPRTALVESFSVMTRLPHGLGVPPPEARRLLHAAFAERATLVGEDAARTWDLLDRALEVGARGGAVHDLDILRCAAAAGAGRLATLDAEDFLRFGSCGVTIVVP